MFLNAKSGAGLATAAQIKALFDQQGCSCIITRMNRSLDLAALARTDSPDTIFLAAGGDGTVNTVAAAVAGTGRSMGVLALGTLNHFAKDLGIPTELEAAVAFAALATPRPIDAAEVNGLLFVNNSSLGVYPSMVLDRDRMKKSGRNKWASLVLASARAFVRFRCLQVDVEVDGQVRRVTTPFLFVGNNEYCLDGARIGSRPSLDQGHLSLYLAPGASRASMLRMLAAAVLGRIKQDPDYREFNVRHFTVRTRKRRFRVSFDGEVRRMDGPLHYTVRPAALQVLAPAPQPPA